MRSILSLVILLTVIPSYAQGDDTAQRVYNSSQDSVFLVYLNDSSGSPTALGSAFVVAPRTLVTNAHVVDAGDPVLAVGPVRIPVKVLRKDEKNDLAILSVSVDLTSTSLPLSKDLASPGEQIFAIGNPEGLEKTISQGIVSALRKDGERDLLQITSPISHGSSGGPVLDASGKVIGVAVGIYGEGQNLNFAVPVRYVQLLLDAHSESSSLPTTHHSVSEVVTLFARVSSDKYDSDENSPYQKDRAALKAMMPSVLSAASSASDLTSLACVGADQPDLHDEGISAARKLVSEHTSPESRAMLSYVLYQRASFESILASFAADGSTDKADGISNAQKYRSEAGTEASEAIQSALGRQLPIATFVLANVKEDSNDYPVAVSLYQQVVNARPKVCGDDLRMTAMQRLIYDTDKINRTADSERWFRQYAMEYTPSAYDWDSEGDRRVNVRDYAGAADAYERAASGGEFPADYCYASIDRWLKSPTDGDLVLSDGRACVDASAKNTDKNKNAEYAAKLPIVYRAMADVLDSRGVYQPALEYIKESLSEKSDDPYAFYVEARIFSDLQRYSECVSAAQSAIRISDGKYPEMNFQLGNCYFSMEDWPRAESSFRISAKADKTDAASAYNLGLSLERQGFSGDATQWYNEALTRKPEPELRAKILSALGR